MLGTTRPPAVSMATPMLWRGSCSSSPPPLTSWLLSSGYSRSAVEMALMTNGRKVSCAPSQQHLRGTSGALEHMDFWEPSPMKRGCIDAAPPPSCRPVPPHWLAQQNRTSKREASQQSKSRSRAKQYLGAGKGGVALEAGAELDEGPQVDLVAKVEVGHLMRRRHAPHHRPPAPHMRTPEDSLLRSACVSGVGGEPTSGSPGVGP